MEQVVHNWGGRLEGFAQGSVWPTSSELVRGHPDSFRPLADTDVVLRATLDLPGSRDYSALKRGALVLEEHPRVRKLREAFEEVTT